MAGLDIVDTLAGMTLFADLARSQLEAIAETLEEEWAEEGRRLLRQGFTGTGFYVILDGEAEVRVDAQPVITLQRGDFFGELSILLDEPPTADVVAVRPLRCVVVARPELESFLLAYPKVMYRLLQLEARRLRDPFRWR